ncbi:hypothetical protein [Pseudaestuariivita sp.]|uniref:hypothetical protein n=1 Tax=Pseudaestuariivita sp. TaxID=2211669 RepID=UPI004058D040
MIEPRSLQRQSRRLSRLLQFKLGAKGQTLAARHRGVGRYLPHKVRRDLATLEQAETMMGHPKLAMRVDAAKVDAAYRRAHAHLDGVSRHARLKAYLLNVGAVVAFNLVVVATCVILYAKWRGWV